MRKIKDIGRLAVPFALASLLTTTPVYAAELSQDLGGLNTDYLNDTDEGKEIQESMDSLLEENQNSYESSQELADVTAMFEDTTKEFSSMKGTYSALASNYGNIKTIDSSAVYAQYLTTLNNARNDLGIDDKMSQIQNANLSIEDSALQSAFQDLKGKVSKDLTENGLNVGAISEKFNLTLTNDNKSNVMAMAQVNAGASKYEDILKAYKQKINTQTQQSDTEDASQESDQLEEELYTPEEMKDLSESVGVEFEEAEQDKSDSILFESKDMTKGFITTEQILENIKNAGK